MALLAALALAAVGGGCDLLKEEVAAPSENPFLTLTASSTTVPPEGGEVDLEATVTGPDGAARAGLDVEFEATAGALDPATPVRTDADGKARARLRTDRPTEVRARIEVGSLSIAESGALEISVSEEAGDEVEPGTVDLAIEVKPETAELREEVTFVVEASRDGERVGGHLEVEFGDGRSTREPEFGGRTRVTHTFREVGRFRVVVSLTDGEETLLARESVRVPVEEPVRTTVAVSTADEAEAQEPVTIEITVAGEDGGRAEGRVTLDLGDGRNRQLGAISGTYSLEVKYREPGRYRIVAVVEDDDGVTHRDGTGIRIVPPVDYDSRLSLSDSSPVARTPATVTFEVSASDGSVAQGDVFFEFGDSRTSRRRDIRGSTSVEHTWREAGTYTLRATFEDDQSRTTTSQLQITVQEDTGDDDGGGDGDDGGGGGGGGDGGGGGGGGGNDALSPSQISYGDPTAARALDWPVTRNLDVINFFSGNQTWSASSVAGWPGRAFFNPGKNLAGNMWFIRNVNGRWEAAPLEWFFQGMTRQFMTEQIISEHTLLRSTWGGWSPQQGEVLYFFLSTPAWFNARTVNERTNIVRVVWGCSGNC